MPSSLTRREAAFAALGTASAPTLGSRAQGANNRLRAGFIGIANRGGQLLEAAIPNPDLEVAALCDVHDSPLHRWKERIPAAETFTDYRRLLEKKDIDIVFIATPDHWHALQCVHACEAGKDVYVEKPLSLTIVEGRKMAETARRTNRIVQVGLQRRSSRMYAELGERIRSGEFGKITVARAYRINNMAPRGIGIAPDSEPPAGLDWEMWLGPRPKRAFNPNIAPYKFRWWKSYSSQLANWGVHYFDAIRWMLGEEAPASVVSLGGKFAVEDSRDIPDTLETVFEFASGRLLVFGQYEASGVSALKRGEVELRGTNAAVYVGSEGYEVVPERGGQFQTTELRSKASFIASEDDLLDRAHVRNFLDCVKSRKRPNCDVEEGHRSTVFAHLGNIALATKSRVDWDPKTERITSNARANGLLHYRYRAPWELT